MRFVKTGASSTKIVATITTETSISASVKALTRYPPRTEGAVFELFFLITIPYFIQSYFLYIYKFCGSNCSGNKLAALQFGVILSSIRTHIRLGPVHRSPDLGSVSYFRSSRRHRRQHPQSRS